MILIKMLIGFLFFLYSSIFVSKDPNSDVTVERIIDWSKKVIYFDITKSIMETEIDSIALNSTSKLISELNDYKDSLIRQSLFEIVIDSDYLFKDYFDATPHLILYFSGMDNILKRDYIKFSDDLKSVTVRYELSLFPNFISLFFSHEKPYKSFYPLINSKIDKTDYTGIIIYAGDSYSNLEDESKLKDSFFVKVYDMEGKIYFEKRMVDPKALRKWGMLEYSNDTNYKNKDRIGDFPLKLIAKGVYGKNKTDIILDEYSINKLFSNENNVNLLREGKLIIIK